MGYGGHDGQDKFRLRVEGPEVFLLEKALDAVVFELPHVFEGIDRVPGESRYRFRDDEVYFAVEGIRYHLVEACSFLRVCSTDPLIRIDVHEFPVWPLLNHLSIDSHLGLVGSVLLILVS